MNPLNPEVEVHTYEQWENEFRDKLVACGLPVVSASLPSLREHLVEPFALAYEGLSAFLQAIDRALAAGSPAAAARRRELAEAHSWNRRMIEMEELLAKLKAEDEAGRDQPAGAGRE